MTDRFLLFFTGETRDAVEILADQDQRSRAGDAEMLENLHRTKEIGLESRKLLEAGELEQYAELMHEHWLNKRRRSAGMTTDRADELYELARRNGAIGGKLVGAGGGGFLLLYTTDVDRHAWRAGRGRRRRGSVRLRLPRLLRDGVPMTLQVGLAGCGVMGRRRAAALGEDRLAACYDVNADAAAALAQETGATVCSSFDELLEERPDAVLVATSHDALAELAAKALAGGAHVLVEKPGARNAEELGAVAEAAASSGRLLHVGFNHRFHPGIARAVEEALSGDHGEIMYVRGRYGHGGRLGYEDEWRAQPELSGGGELMDQGMHLLDLSHWLLGPLPLHSALLRTNFWSVAVEDNAVLVLGETGETQAPWSTLHVSWTEWKNDFALEIYCRRAKLQVTGLWGSYGPQVAAHLPDGAGARPARRRGARVRRRGPVVGGRVGALPDCGARGPADRHRLGALRPRHDRGGLPPQRVRHSGRGAMTQALPSLRPPPGRAEVPAFEDGWLDPAAETASAVSLLPPRGD